MNTWAGSYEAVGRKVEAKAERAIEEELEEKAVEPKVTPAPEAPKVGT
jgi:hypothetical protein